MFKETGSIISSDPPCKDGALPDLQQYPWNLNLFKSDGRYRRFPESKSV